MNIKIKLPPWRMEKEKIGEMASKLRHAGKRLAAQELKRQYKEAGT